MTHQIAYRGDTGLFLASGPPYGNPEALSTAKNCKVMTFDHIGSKLAWSDGKTVCIQDPKGQNSSITFEAGRTQFMFWSPKDTYLATWEVFAVRDGQKDSNLKIWDVSSGQIKASFISRKSEGWQPRWSQDEDIVAIKTPNNEVGFYKGHQFDNPDKRLSVAKMDSFSLSPNAKNVVVFVPGQKGAPGFAKMFAFPAFNPEKDVIANKSFMLADKMDAKWSADSKSCLLLMQCEVDKTGSSYYGKSQLHFMDIFGETSMVQMAKEGPIYSVDWAPNTSQFIVVYGFMPAKATLFNKKCEKVFDFGTGARNTALFNTQGTLLLLGGFGNLRGTIEIWDIEGKKSVATFEAADSTEVKWSPDGQHILTATTAPRLRVSNGLKIWHYTSTLLHEINYKDATNLGPGEELWEASWKPDTEIGKSQFKILNKPISGGIKPQQPQASKQAYVPPNARGGVNKTGVFKSGKSIPGRNTKLHDEDELPENMKGKEGAENLSKSAAKNKKRREAAKKKKEEEEADASTNKAVNLPMKNEPTTTGDPEKDKKIRKINDKLTQIAKLKEQVKSGKQLEVNQLEKIKKESELLEELKSLRL